MGALLLYICYNCTMEVTNNAVFDEISHALQHYVPSDETIALVRNTKIVLLVGIAGAGKDTIKHKLLETGQYHHIVSHTTRLPRANNGITEIDGVEYHFISPEVSLDMVKRGAYVEAKFVHGTVYGTSVAEIMHAEEEHAIALTDVDVQGVDEYKKISDNVIAIFILPPNFEEWQRRLLARYGHVGADPLDIAKRMLTAIAELEHALKAPYYHFIVNDDLSRAVEVAGKIAHSDDSFNEIDEQVRAQAEQLLADIRAHVA